jgi:hypothetical protein
MIPRRLPLVVALAAVVLNGRAAAPAAPGTARAETAGDPRAGGARGRRARLRWNG